MICFFVTTYTAKPKSAMAQFARARFRRPRTIHNETEWLQPWLRKWMGSAQNYERPALLQHRTRHVSSNVCRKAMQAIKFALLQWLASDASHHKATSLHCREINIASNCRKPEIPPAKILQICLCAIASHPGACAPNLTRWPANWLKATRRDNRYENEGGYKTDNSDKENNQHKTRNSCIIIRCFYNSAAWKNIVTKNVCFCISPNIPM